MPKVSVKLQVQLMILRKFITTTVIKQNIHQSCFKVMSRDFIASMVMAPVFMRILNLCIEVKNQMLKV